MNKWISTLNVSKKMTLLIGVVTVLMLVMQLVFAISASSLEEDFESFEQESFRGATLVLSIEKDLNYFSRTTREIMLGGDYKENTQKLHDLQKSINEQFTQLEKVITDEDEQNKLKNAKASSLSLLNSACQMIDSYSPATTSLEELKNHYHAIVTPAAKKSRHQMEELVKLKIASAHQKTEIFKNHVQQWKFTAIIVAIVMIALMFLFTSTISKQIKKAVESTQKGIASFLDFLEGKTDKYDPIEAVGSDEFARMAHAVNDEVKNVEKSLNDNALAIQTISTFCNHASQGYLYDRLHTNSTDKTIRELSTQINGMLSSFEKVLFDVRTILVAYCVGDYVSSKNVNTTHYTGSFGSLVKALDALGTCNSEIFALIERFSQEFTNQSHVLAKGAEELSTAANEQASSLEETAAAIEEITSNISATASKADEMAVVAREAKEAADSGTQVAQVSLTAMNEIFQATNAINEAVAIIDNIAFQTNILSLNAAVEAATAGDAGKGFAVVAQEVRNLANRSAEAAKQIQDLAHTARSKSQGGLETTQNVMNSFSIISEKIAQTDLMVRDVTNASREQMAGITQINDAVAQLDQMTQQNAKLASNISAVGEEIYDRTESFNTIVKRVEFDTQYHQSSCDINLLFDSSRLKLDHVNFKENNYAKIATATSSWSVTSHHDCNLGKWLKEHENDAFAQTDTWTKLLKDHEQVHKCTQDFISASTQHDNSAHTVQTLQNIGKNIENATKGVFEGLDEIKKLNCKNS